MESWIFFFSLVCYSFLPCFILMCRLPHIWPVAAPSDCPVCLRLWAEQCVLSLPVPWFCVVGFSVLRALGEFLLLGPFCGQSHSARFFSLIQCLHLCSPTWEPWFISPTLQYTQNHFRMKPLPLPTKAYKLSPRFPCRSCCLNVTSWRNKNQNAVCRSFLG